MLKHEDPNEVNEKSSHRDRKQTLVVNIRRLQSSLHSFREDEEGCEDEKEPVYEPCENFCTDIPVGEAVIGSPPGDDGGCESCQQGGAVKEHVERV